MTNSKQKGKRGELEFARFLRQNGIDARRGQQYKGTPDSPDVVSDMDDIHWEVKRTEKLQLYKFLDKAVLDAGMTQTPVIAYRKNKREWVCILDAVDFLRLLHDRK